MVVNSLGKLQIIVDKQEKEILELKEKLSKRDDEINSLKQSLKYYKKNIDSIVQKAVEKAVSEIVKENEKLREENNKLKRILNNDSNNTGLPTSKTPIGKEKRIPNSRETTNLKKGGQEGHKKHKLEKFNDNEITDTYTYEIKNTICSCGGKLNLIGKRYKDEFDVDIRLIKRRNEFCEYECECCGKQIKVPIPNRLKEENQYGTNVQALATSLTNEGCVSFHRTKELISGFTGGELNMSEGYIAKLQKRCYEKLQNFDNELYKKLLTLKVINWDDTVIAINGKNACLRFYGNEQLKYYRAHEKKNKDGIDKDGILPYLNKDTVVVHDHNIVNYNDDYEFTNAECCVHLIRDLNKLNEVLPRKWIKKLIELIVSTNKLRNEYIDKNILEFDYKVSDKVIEKYDQIIKEAREINKADYNTYYGQEEKTLIKRLIDYKENYLLWVLRFDIPFSNNLSERSLRSSKTKMKVSGQFSNIKNAEYFATIKSYIETCKSNGINAHTALIRLIEDNPYTIEEILKQAD